MDIELSQVSDGDLYHQWWHAKQQLDAAKLNESKLREEIADRNLKSPGQVIIKLGETHQIEVKQAYSLTVDQKKAVQVFKTLRGIESAEAKDLIKWKADISMARYKKLSDGEKQIASECCSIKPAKATVTLKEIPNGD